MKLPRFVRLWLMQRDLDGCLAQRRIARKIRSEAAQRGFSTQCKRRAERCRAKFGAAL